MNSYSDNTLLSMTKKKLLVYIRGLEQLLKKSETLAITEFIESVYSGYSIVEWKGKKYKIYMEEYDKEKS